MEATTSLTWFRSKPGKREWGVEVPGQVRRQLTMRSPPPRASRAPGYTALRLRVDA
jgi:hypothetical protein